MLHAKAAAVGLAVSLMLTASALARGIGEETPTQIRAFTDLVQKVDLADAVASAESGMRGKVIYIRFVEPPGQFTYPSYAAVLLTDGKLVLVNVDPITGIASMPTIMDARSAAAFDQEQRVAETLKRPQSPLQQAIDMAQKYTNGQAIEAWPTERQGQPAYVIGVVKARQVRMVTVDPMTDKVAWLSRATMLVGATAPNPDAPGGRELATLNLFEGTGQ